VNLFLLGPEFSSSEVWVLEGQEKEGSGEGDCISVPLPWTDLLHSGATTTQLPSGSFWTWEHAALLCSWREQWRVSTAHFLMMRDTQAHTHTQAHSHRHGIMHKFLLPCPSIQTWLLTRAHKTGAHIGGERTVDSAEDSWGQLQHG